MFCIPTTGLFLSLIASTKVLQANGGNFTRKSTFEYGLIAVDFTTICVSLAMVS